MSLCVAVLAGAALSVPSAASAATWSVQSTPDPSLAVTAGLGGVACAGASACTSVGRSTDVDGVPTALAQGWNGSSWTLQTPATPRDAVSTDLLAVSCTASDACTAVGYYDAGSGPQPLVERWNGSSWSVQSAPAPSGALASYLLGVACSSATECTAVGSYVDENGVEKTLALRWTSGSWSIQTTPNPTDAPSSRLASVSCTSATACTAVGSSTDRFGVGSTLVLTLSSGTWSITTTPSSGADASYLSAISCPASGSCTAVGVGITSGVSAPLALRLASGRWTVETPPSPLGSDGAALTGVACTSTACTAVGYSVTGSTYSPLAQDRTTGWGIVTTPLPTGALGGRLFGVSCSASAVCTAGGQFSNARAEQRTLAERYQ